MTTAPAGRGPTPAAGCPSCAHRRLGRAAARSAARQARDTPCRRGCASGAGSARKARDISRCDVRDVIDGARRRGATVALVLADVDLQRRRSRDLRGAAATFATGEDGGEDPAENPSALGCPAGTAATAGRARVRRVRRSVVQRGAPRRDRPPPAVPGAGEVSSSGRRRACSASCAARTRDLPVTVNKVEQSNSSAIVGDRLMLKLFRRLESGINPDLEVTRFLTDERFPNVAALAGFVAYRTRTTANRPPSRSLQEFVPNEGDVWALHARPARRLRRPCRGRRRSRPGRRTRRSARCSRAPRRMPRRSPAR